MVFRIISAVNGQAVKSLPHVILHIGQKYGILCFSIKSSRQKIIVQPVSQTAVLPGDISSFVVVHDRIDKILAQDQCFAVLNIQYNPLNRLSTVS